MSNKIIKWFGVFLILIPSLWVSLGLMEGLMYREHGGLGVGAIFWVYELIIWFIGLTLGILLIRKSRSETLNSFRFSPTFFILLIVIIIGFIWLGRTTCSLGGGC